MPKVKIKFPALVYLNGILSVDRLEYLKQIGAKFEGENLLVVPERRSREKPGWILSRDGEFFVLTPVGKRREWMRPLQKIWEFVVSCYSIGNPTSITVMELEGRIAGIREGSIEVPTARNLKAFLSMRDPAEIVSFQTLSDWNIGN